MSRGEREAGVNSFIMRHTLILRHSPESKFTRINVPDYILPVSKHKEIMPGGLEPQVYNRDAATKYDTPLTCETQKRLSRKQPEYESEI